jgi:Rad3-related DNA helicase
MEKLRLAEVFSTVGLPRYTYVKPRHFGEVRADIEQPGKHLLIEGPSGIGKTCVVYKVFEELQWTRDVDYTYVTARDHNAAERVTEFIAAVVAGQTPQPSLIVVDDFHLLPQEIRNGFGSILKRLSDRAFEQKNPPKAVLIGIPTTGTALLLEANDLGPRLGSYRFKGASDSEINKLLDEGEGALGVIFEDREYVLSESSQNFWLAQHIANKICSTQEVFEQQEDVKILTFDLLSIRQRLMDELSQRYLGTAVTFAKGKKWRPGGNKPYLDVLLALAKNPDLTVTYDKILNLVPERLGPGSRR